MTNDQILRLIDEEVERAEKKHPLPPGGVSPRHSHSVIEEEYDEFWEAIKTDDHIGAYREAVQLAATCVRYLKNHAPSSVRQFH